MKALLIIALLVSLAALVTSVVILFKGLLSKKSTLFNIR